MPFKTPEFFQRLGTSDYTAQLLVDELDSVIDRLEAHSHRKIELVVLQPGIEVSLPIPPVELPSVEASEPSVLGFTYTDHGNAAPEEHADQPA